jgi:hypothetical protein
MFYDIKEVEKLKKEIKDKLLLLAIDTMAIPPNLLNNINYSKITTSNNTLGILNFFRESIYTLDFNSGSLKDSTNLLAWNIEEYWDKFKLVPKDERNTAKSLLAQYLLDKCSSSNFELKGDTLFFAVAIPFVRVDNKVSKTYIDRKVYLIMKIPSQKMQFSLLPIKKSINSFLGLPIINDQIYVFANADTSSKFALQWRTHPTEKGFNKPFSTLCTDSVLIHSARYYYANSGFICADSTAFNLRTKNIETFHLPIEFKNFDLFYFSNDLKVLIKDGTKQIVIITNKGTKIFNSDTAINRNRVSVYGNTIYLLDKTGLIKIRIV